VETQGTTLTSEESREVLHQIWQMQVDTFHSMSVPDQDKLVRMYTVPPTSLPQHLQHHLAAFAKLSSSTSASSSSDVVRIRTSTKDHDEATIRQLVPLVFLSNACEWGSTGSHALPLLASLVAHSCAPNASRLVDPAGRSLELLARRDLKSGEMLTLDYLAAQLWSRRERQSSLRDSKCFECFCERCRAPDWEGAMVCPLCWPLAQREAGFTVVPSPNSKEPPHGFVVEHPVAKGSSHASSVGGEWACTLCTKRMKGRDLEIPLPEGTPATTYLGLARYAEDLVRAGLEDPGCLELHHVRALAAPLALVVGERHWTYKWLTVQLLKLTGDPQEVERCLRELFDWMETWAFLEPIRILGAKTLMDAADKLAEGGKWQIAFKYYLKVADNVPKYTPVYKAVTQSLRKCHQHGIRFTE